MDAARLLTRRHIATDAVQGQPNPVNMTVYERVSQLYEAERERICSYLLYWGLPPARAQEVVQEAFLKLYWYMSRGKAIENPRAWLYKVAHNLAARSFEREPEFDCLNPNLIPFDMHSDPEQELIEQRRREAFWRAVRDLSPQQRNCLHLRAEGMRYREIAEAIGISTSAVGEFLRRAAVRLKEALNG